MTPPVQHKPTRSGAVAVEMAVLLPLLAMLIVIGLDFARVFYAYATITTCARNAAIFASDSTASQNSPYTTYQAAGMADGANLHPALTASNFTQTSGTDAYGSYIEVTVTYDFQLISGLLGSSTQTLQRRVRMRVAPGLPG